MNDLRWRFPRANKGQKTGFNDAGISSFTGDRIGSMTREIIQNSLDAKDSNSEGQPVIIEFKTFDVLREEFPDKESLLIALKKSYNEVNKLNDPRYKKFFSDSINIINQKTIPFLRISDFNTCGLLGVTEKGNSPWHYLVKSQGISDKGKTDGGSFGIGKNAVFACSDFRTVIYSTYTTEGDKGTQGVSNLISYDLDDIDDYTQGVGYLSISDDHEPLLDNIALDKTFSRNKPGTDIYVSGLMKDENITNKIVQAVLDSFMYAIFKSTLEVVVNDVHINKDTLGKIVNSQSVDVNQTTLEMYNILTSESVHVFDEDILNKNNKDIEIRLLIREESSRKISVIRKPWMKIKELTGFQRAYQFSGVVIITSNQLNELLRNAENPQHNNWETGRIFNNETLKKNIDYALSEISKRVRNRLDELHQVDLNDFAELFGAEEYIQMINEDGKKNIQKKVEDKVISLAINNKPISPATSVIESYDDGEDIVDLDGNEENDDFDKPQPLKDSSLTKNNYRTENLKSTGKKVRLRKNQVKLFSIDKNNGINRLVIDSENKIQCNIQVILFDEQTKPIMNTLKIIDISKKTSSDQSIEKDFICNMILEKGLNIIDITINQKGFVSLGVEVYEI